MNPFTKSLLDFDPVAEAEKIIPRHKEGADLIVLAMAFLYSENKAEHLQAIGDSHYSMAFDDMITMALDEGFVKVYEKEFIDDTYPERYIIFFNENDGIIITLESYRGHVNNAKMYYNIDLNPDGYENGCTSSGHFFINPDETYSIYIGDHDIREGFRFHLNHLRENGKFLAKWVERPWLWFLTYMDTKGGYDSYDYKAINESVIAQFPQNVIDAITPRV